MREFLLQYGLFLAETVTLAGAVAGLVLLVASAARREPDGERLRVRNLNRRYEDVALALERETLPAKAFKARTKSRRRARKAEAKRAAPAPGRRVFVLDFKGDIRASAVTSLREEISALLQLATKHDEVLVRLENSGGLVHDHGLAASQLLRVRERGIPLTVAVDKVAASGGYMMACVANRILAAPFAILGSIGVLAQLPNFNRMLDAHGVDVEQFKGGRFKRTVTMFGRNTDEDRAKLGEEIEDIHALFKEFVAEHRPALDLERVATGEHWYGRRALALGLCDTLSTSDDYLLEASREARLYEVRYEGKRTLGRRLAAAVEAVVDRGPLALRQRLHDDRFAL